MQILKVKSQARLDSLKHHAHERDFAFSLSFQKNHLIATLLTATAFLLGLAFLEAAKDSQKPVKVEYRDFYKKGINP